MLWLIANLLIRSALILGAGTLLSRLFPRLRPSQRHATVLVSFVLLALWPLFAAFLPEVTLPIGKPSPGSAHVTVQQFAAGQRSAPVADHFVFSPLAFWAAAACFSLAPLLIAQLRLRTLLKRSVICEDSAWNALAVELCAQLDIPRAPALLIHPGRVMPMASGVLRTRILLPAECTSWTPLRRRVVLLHELAHIARRDLLSQRLARLVTALWWFQPLSWSALRLLRRESERACDELAIRSGMRPSDYAAELLGIAQSFSAIQCEASLAMARSDGLEIRLHSILQAPDAGSPAPLRIALSFLCLTALTLAAAAVNLSPSQAISPRGHMKHTLFTGLLVSAGLSAATIGGSLYDPSGAAVPNAKAMLYDPDTNSKFETTTTAEGKFAFETLPAGQYILRVQSPGFATLFREFKVQADSKVDRGLTLSMGKVKETVNISAAGSPAAAAAPSVATPPKRLRIGGAVEQANLISKVQPVYPPAAKAARVQGTVELEMVVSKDGEPLDLRVLSSPSDDLTQATLEAVRQWRYRPTLLNGNPVEIVTDVICNYTLSN